MSIPGDFVETFQNALILIERHSVFQSTKNLTTNLQKLAYKSVEMPG